VATAISMAPLHGNPKKRGRKGSFAGLPEEEKKKRFLERNRKAAQKCREKKKVVIEQLKSDADVAQKIFEDLDLEVKRLRTVNEHLYHLKEEHQATQHTRGM